MKFSKTIFQAWKVIGNNKKGFMENGCKVMEFV